MVLEGTALFVQHTSKKLITSELAGDMALELVWSHFRKTGPITGGGSISRVVDENE